MFKGLWFGEKGLSILAKCLSGSIWLGLCQRRLVAGQGHVIRIGLGFKWTVQKAKGILPACLVELDYSTNILRDLLELPQ